ncbi:MAG: DUF4065 domain-containing protein [Betaproteobacteria bacterium]|nr:DUF4065 domain-containing protein [Betaproteobacteria bacterium]
MSQTATSAAGIDPRLAGHYVLAACKQANISKVRPLKFLKLVYIAHGYHLALEGSPLINVPVEAWKYGPVIKELYLAVKKFGGKTIPFDLLAGYVREDGQDHSSYKQVISEVIASYGKYDGLVLSAATHREGTPWSIVYNRDGLDAPIGNDILKEYYKTLLD